MVLMGIKRGNHCSLWNCWHVRRLETGNDVSEPRNSGCDRRFYAGTEGISGGVPGGRGKTASRFERRRGRERCAEGRNNFWHAAGRRNETGTLETRGTS